MAERPVLASNTPWSLRGLDEGGFREHVHASREQLLTKVRQLRGSVFVISQVAQGPALVVLTRGDEGAD